MELVGDIEKTTYLLRRLEDAVLLRPVGTDPLGPFSLLHEELERRRMAAYRICDAIMNIGILDEVGDLADLVSNGHSLLELESRATAAWLDYRISHPGRSVLATFLEDVMSWKPIRPCRLATLYAIMPAMNNVHVTSLTARVAELDDREERGSLFDLIWLQIEPRLRNCSEALRICINGV